MGDCDYRYPALQLVVVADVKHVGNEHVQTDSTSVHISCAPAVAVGLEVFLQRIERATTRLERAGAWTWFGTRGHLAAVVMSLDGHQRKRLRDSVDPLQLEVPAVEEAVLEKEVYFRFAINTVALGPARSRPARLPLSREREDTSTSYNKTLRPVLELGDSVRLFPDTIGRLAARERSSTTFWSCRAVKWSYTFVMYLSHCRALHSGSGLHRNRAEAAVHIATIMVCHGHRSPRMTAHCAHISMQAGQASNALRNLLSTRASRSRSLGTS